VWTLGISEQWQFVDVWGFESDLLQMLPRPVCAVLLLYPLSDKVFSVHFNTVKCYVPIGSRPIAFPTLWVLRIFQHSCLV